jgi:hypothetical protein
MGVDITAYSKLELTEPHDPDDACYDDEPLHIEAFVYVAHRRSGDGLAGLDDSYDGVLGGRHYAVTADTVELEICSISYSGYGYVRRELCWAVHGVEIEVMWGDESRRQDPFMDLLYFADNAGTIGPVAAARLARDFSDETLRQRFIAISDVPGFPAGDWWDRWRRGAELAADGGLIRFH